MNQLVDILIKEGWLKTPRIISAFRKIKRADFLPEDIKDLAEVNEALPIGFGQTISQPLVVAFMLEQLQPKEGDKILDVGAGSGWTAALLGEIIGEKGRVIAIEVLPDLQKFGEENVAKYNFIKSGRIRFICADGSKGYAKESPFDKILCSAAIQLLGSEKFNNGVEKLPRAWKEQLKIGGRIAAPIGSSIWLFVKKSPSFARRSLGEGELRQVHRASAGEEKEFEEKEYPGFAFVPLVIKK